MWKCVCVHNFCLSKSSSINNSEFRKKNNFCNSAIIFCRDFFHRIRSPLIIPKQTHQQQQQQQIIIRTKASARAMSLQPPLSSNIVLSNRYFKLHRSKEIVSDCIILLCTTMDGMREMANSLKMKLKSEAADGGVECIQNEQEQQLCLSDYLGRERKER